MTESSSEMDVAISANCRASQPGDRSATLRLPDESADDAPCQTMLLNDSTDGKAGARPPAAGESLQQGITAAKAGNRPLARLHLEQAIKTDPDDPVCWLWLAWTAESPTAAISSLEQARLNCIDAELIQHGLAWAQGMLDFKPGDVAGVDSPQASGEDAADAARPQVHTQKLSPKKQKQSSKKKSKRQAPAAKPVARTVPVPQDAPPDAKAPEKSAEDTPGPSAPEDDLDGCVDSIRTELDEFFSSINPLTNKVEPVKKPKSGDTNREAAPSKKEEDPPTGAANKNRPTILAIDDSPTIRSLVKICLEKCGYEVVTASDGMEALEPLKNRELALILMDINMPRLNGYQLCKLVKKNAETQSIPVIMLSGKDGVFDKLRGKLSGCDDYITKPFEAADLVQKVSNYLQQAARV